VPERSPLRCAVLDDYQGAAQRYADWTPLEGRVAVEVFREHLDNEDALAAALRDFDIVMLMRERTPFPRTLIERLPGLRLLSTTGARNASVDVAACRDHGVVFCGTRSSGHAAAELTWALILAQLRHLPLENGNLRAGGAWQSTEGLELAGRRLGVIGLGRLGIAVAKVGKAFGMDVMAWSRNLDDARCAEAGAVRAGDLRELLAESDIVTLHLPLNEDSRGMIGAGELRSMKRDAFLVNTSRGPIVDEAALVRALREGWIAGAALDVFDQEPLPADHPLRTLPNVLATPHIGYVTAEAYRLFYADAVENIVAWLDGKPLRVIEPPVSQGRPG